VDAPGGYAAYSHNLCAVLRALGRQVHIVALGNRDSTTDTELGQLHVVRNELASRIPFIGDVQMTALPLFSRSFAARIASIAGDQPCLMWGMGPWALAGALFKRRSPASVLLASYFTTFLHEMRGSLAAIPVADYGWTLKAQYAGVVGVIGPAFRAMEGFLLRAADKVVTHYRSTEDILSAELGVPRDRFHRMTYYTEVFGRPVPSPLPENPPRPLIVTVCRQDPRKGINFLVHAMALLKERGVAAHCVVVGGGSMLERNRRLAARLNVADRVSFPGFVGDVRAILQAADIFAFPAVEEGSGSLSVLEAMSVGAPMVLSAIDGLPEDVTHGESGWLVPSRDPSALADGLQKLLSDKPLALRLGRGALDAYQRKFSMAAMQRDVEALLSSVSA
jgi:glycosyltransferase involved in cell wall biosynthesis